MLNITTASYTDHAVSTTRSSSHLSSLSLPGPSRQKHPDLSDSLLYSLVNLMPLLYLPCGPEEDTGKLLAATLYGRGLRQSSSKRL